MKTPLSTIVLFGTGLLISLAGLSACSTPAATTGPGSSMAVPVPTHSGDWKAGRDEINKAAGEIPQP